MLLSLTTTHTPATDLGYLLHKNPKRAQCFGLSFGAADVFYPEVSENRCTAALLLDVDPVALVRSQSGRNSEGRTLAQYVNDRPYVASSFLSVAIAQVFGSALGGRCKDKPEAALTLLPLEARLDVVPSRGGETLIRRLFEPLGYAVQVTPYSLDVTFSEWGQSPYFSVTLTATARLADLLTHLYVLVPALDTGKHYFIGDLQRGMVRQHDAAGADPQARRFAGDLPNQQCRGRAGNAGHVMMLRQPVAVVAQRIRQPG